MPRTMVPAIESYPGLRMIVGLCSIALLFLIGACAEDHSVQPVAQNDREIIEAHIQSTMAFRSHQAEFDRLQSIGDRLRIGASPLCKDLSPRYGWNVANKFSFKPKIRTMANAEYALDDKLKIIRVTPRGPAAQAGILIGDEIAAVNGSPVEGPEADRRFEAAAENAGWNRAPLQLEVLRSGRTVPVMVNAVLACRNPIHLAGSEVIYANTDANRIFVSEGMLHFASDDNELALVIAHELGHGLEGHGASVRSRPSEPSEIELEADCLGLYVMALSGFDITRAADFWRRVAILHPKDIVASDTHPTTPSRYVAMQANVQEIRYKQTRGLSIEPDVHD